MAWPSALNVIPVHIKITRPNAAQTPAIGRVVFDLPFPLRDALDSVIVGHIPPIVAELDENGEATVELPATNDPQITPINWTYLVKVETDAYRQQFQAVVPYDHVGILEFDTMTPAVTPPALIVYALAGHTHTDLVPKSLFTTKGDLVAATAPSTVARLPIGVDGRLLAANAATATGLEWILPPSGGGLTNRGAWAPATEYQPGDVVTYRDATYWTPDGAAANDAPVTDREFFGAAAPPNVDPADATNYQFLAQVTPLRNLRIKLGNYYKIATQNQVPHEMRVYRPSYATDISLLSSTIPGEVAGAVGRQTTRMTADLLAGTQYALTLVTGAGTDAGYRYDPAFPFPLTVGSLRLDAGGFAASHVNINGITSPTTLYAGVTPTWEDPSAAWVLIGRTDPVYVGTSRAVAMVP